MVTSACYPTEVDPGAGCLSSSSRRDRASSAGPFGGRRPARGSMRRPARRGLVARSRPRARIASAGRAGRAATPSRPSGRPSLRSAARSAWSSLTTSRAPAAAGPAVARVSSTSESEQLVGAAPAGVADEQPGRDALAAHAGLRRPVEDELDADGRRDDRPAAGRSARPAARRPACATGRGAGSCRR